MKFAIRDQPLHLSCSSPCLRRIGGNFCLTKEEIISQEEGQSKCVEIGGQSRKYLGKKKGISFRSHHECNEFNSSEITHCGLIVLKDDMKKKNPINIFNLYLTPHVCKCEVGVIENSGSNHWLI